MKILHIGKYFSPFNGGLENYMRDAMVALARRGISCAALVHGHGRTLRSKDEVFNADGHQFHITRTAMWARIMYTPISPAFAWQLRRSISRNRPDILHLHLPNPSTFWAIFLLSARKLPWVVHWHSDIITSNQDPLMRFVYRLYQPFERAVLKRAAVIIATSPPYRDTSLPLQEWRDKCQVVPLGLDTKRYSLATRASNDPVGAASDLQGRRKCRELSGTIPARRDCGPKRQASRGETPTLQILAIGRLTYYKGFKYLIEAIAKTPGAHLDLVGHGDQAKQLKRLTASLKLQERVTFHGKLDDTELAQQMLDCDCLCLPSVERTEAFGMVLLEAMYFGKATIISDVEGSGMGWVVDDGSTGIKVKPGDSEALALAFNSLMENREHLNEMGQAGKRKFSQEFAIDQAVEGLVDIYQQYAHNSAL